MIFNHFAISNRLRIYFISIEVIWIEAAHMSQTEKHLISNETFLFNLAGEQLCARVLSFNQQWQPEPWKMFDILFNNIMCGVPFQFFFDLKNAFVRQMLLYTFRRDQTRWTDE